jgi:hypothetical protein
VDSKQRGEDRRRIIEQRRQELLSNLGKGGVSMSSPTTTGPKVYAVLLFDGKPGEENSPQKMAKGLNVGDAGLKAQAWLELADLYVGFPYIVIMAPPTETPAAASAAAKSRPRPFPPASPGG